MKIPVSFYLVRQDFLPVLDATGHIYKLDLKKLELAGRLGWLPAVAESPELQTAAGPADLLYYQLMPLVVKDEYRGFFTASLSRDGMNLAVAAFSADGQLVGTDFIDKNVFDPTGWLFWAVRYLLENLHPPVLSVASFFTAGSFTPAAGHRALLLPPYSFISQGANYQPAYLLRFLFGLFIILPSILLGVSLAKGVARDARMRGLSRPLIEWWVVGTLALTLAAYITYRLTRPAIRMVTCKNCGNLRRPDLEYCQHCRADWSLPELAPPLWRIEHP